jgi:CheY-like chemotaxis protein
MTVETKWRILVVDDEEDVHAVTNLALKRRSWKGRAFDIVPARSAADAKKVLAAAKEPFDVALVDVVMETDSAGLDLCEHIRATQTRATRIVLRTGQPGVAPEEKVLNDFDIDYYLAKAEVTQERLYTTVRACLRSSQDVSTIITVMDQLQGYVKVIQHDDSLDSLVSSFNATLAFLERKFNVGVAVFTELAQGHRAEAIGPAFATAASGGKLKLDDVRGATAKRKAADGEFKPERVGDLVYLPFNFVSRVQVGAARKGLFDKLATFLGGSGGWLATGCLVVHVPPGTSDAQMTSIAYDVRLFCQNWKLAYQLLCTQKAITDAASGVGW